MILEVALPHEHVTWTATKVTEEPVPNAEITPHQKGKLVNNKQLLETLSLAFKSRGPIGKYQFENILALERE
jgi:hypothetical protein